MLTREDETELLTALHQGVLEQPLWATFLERLRGRTGASKATLVFRRADSPIAGIIELFAGKADPPDLRRRYLDELYRTDPLPYHRLRPGRVFALSEFVDPTDPAHVAFTREFLEPMEIRDLRVVRIAEPGGYSAWLTIHRGDGAFGSTEGALLTTIAQHLAIALQTFSALEEERTRHGISADVVRRLNFSWFTLDARGLVTDADATAEELLRRSPILRRSAQGRLIPADAQAERALNTALRAIAGGSVERAHALHLGDDPWLDMLLVPLRDRRLSGPRTAVATAYVHGEGRSPVDRGDQMRELFGLTRGEARLALALSRGRKISEAAEELGLTIETARNYSKRVYSKTGTRGQADLVRLILASVVMLA
ncbi:MAG: helix-turn-helix transcriptional regulator [Allosphingosinicella sp.]